MLIDLAWLDHKGKLNEKETIYRCEYCNKPYHSSLGCMKHEKWCFSNPENKACKSCTHFNYECHYDGSKKLKNNQFRNSNIYINCSGWEARNYD